MAATEGDNEAVVKLLLDKGADATAKDDMGARATDIAVQEEANKVAKLLQAIPTPGPEGDRSLKINLAVNIDHKGLPAAQSAEVDVSVPDSGATAVPLQQQAKDYGLKKCPEGCKSMVTTEFLAADGLDAAALGELQGVISMSIEGALAENKLFMSYEADLKEIDGQKLYFVALYLNADWHATAVETQAVVSTLKQIKGRLEVTQPLLTLLETFVDGGEDPALPKYFRLLNAQIVVDESVLSSEMLSSLPKKLPESLLLKLDTEMVPLQHAEGEINVDFDGPLLFSIMEDKMGIATVGALTEAAKQAPVDLPGNFKKLIKGLLRAKVVAESGAAINIDFGGVLPVFQLLPCKEGDDEGEDDDDDDWE